MSEGEKNFDESRAGFLLVHAKRRVLWGKNCGRLACAVVLQAVTCVEIKRRAPRHRRDIVDLTYWLISTQAFHMTIIIQFFLTTALVLGCAQINQCVGCDGVVKF